MPHKKQILSNFSGNIRIEQQCYRPEFLNQMDAMRDAQLARGQGLSYNDSCFSKDGAIVLSERLSHIHHFDAHSGQLICEAGLPLRDLFTLHPNWMPAVVPGTLHATVGGAIAHDVHGKNHCHQGSFADHVLWLELQIQDKIYRISAREHPKLWRATIGGAGLSGIILRAGIQLIQQSHFIEVKNTHFSQYEALLDTMKNTGKSYGYQVAWLDLLHDNRSILSLAHPCNSGTAAPTKYHTIPSLPFSLLGNWNMKLFNRCYYQRHKDRHQRMHFIDFNNPLDKLRNWSNMYGPKGLIQLQCSFPEDSAYHSLLSIRAILEKHNLVPFLSVLKLFGHAGKGYLSFPQPGFTLAMDFKNTSAAKVCMTELHDYLLSVQGRVYLAKDCFLSQGTFRKMYPEVDAFQQALQHYHSPMRSLLGKRLGIHA